MRPVALIAMLAALVAAAPGCGGGGKRTIPTKNAEQMLAQLDTISQQFDSQSCRQAQANASSLENKASSLPKSVDQQVQHNLVTGIRRLERLLSRDCARQTRTNTTTTPTNTTPTNTTPTNTTPTNTTPPTTTTPPPTSTTPPPTTTNPTGPTTPSGGVTAPGGTTGASGARTLSGSGGSA